MGYYDPDLYHQPEKFGLRPVFEYELREPCYSFDTFVMWKHEDGPLYWAHDSGCSCPSPFEDYTSLDDALLYNYYAIEEFLRGYIGAYDSRITEDNIEGILYDIRREAR